MHWLGCIKRSSPQGQPAAGEKIFWDFPSSCWQINNTVEEANELRAYAEEIKQRRPAHNYLQPTRQYVTALDLDALKNDFLRQATEFSRLPKLSKCHVTIESMKP